jgi:hypothetical protein
MGVGHREIARREDSEMPRPSFPVVAIIFVMLVGSFVGGVVFSRWFDFQRTGHTIRDGRRVTTTGSSNPSSDEPLLTAQILRAALDKACENSASRGFYGPGVYNLPLSLWDEALNPTPVPQGEPKKSAQELRDEKDFQNEVEGHKKELQNICGNRDRMSDADLILPSQWLCEAPQIPDQPSPDYDQKFKYWENFPSRHHFSEERFNELYVAFDLAMEAPPEGKLRQEGQCLRARRVFGVPNRPTMHEMEADAAQGVLCDARDASSRSGQNTEEFQWALSEFAEGNNVSTQSAREILEQAIRDAKTKEPDVTWAEYCASASPHNDDRSRLDLSVFARALSHRQ